MRGSKLVSPRSDINSLGSWRKLHIVISSAAIFITWRYLGFRQCYEILAVGYANAVIDWVAPESRTGKRISAHSRHWNTGQVHLYEE